MIARQGLPQYLMARMGDLLAKYVTKSRPALSCRQHGQHALELAAGDDPTKKYCSPNDRLCYGRFESRRAEKQKGLFLE
jgi:hypothetical protein